jgi:peptide/nickel transport system substrate-binding protein
MSTLYQNRNYDTLVFSNCQGFDPEIGVRRLYHSSAITGAPFTNGAGYKNDAVDQAFDEAAQRVDQAERTPIYNRAATQIGRDLPYLWIVENVANRAYRSSCEGLKAYTGHFAETGFCRR